MWNKRLLATLSICIIITLAGLKAHAERQVVINIPAFTLYLYDQGVPIKSYPISIGSVLNPSVLGETTIINKVADPTYYPPKGEPILPGPDNPVGTRWLGLGFSGYGIHGTNNPASIGSPASSGCIRMQNEDVEELADLVKVGTPVQLVYQTILIQNDPLLHTKTITVYPDVYKQGVSPIQLQEELERIKWGNVFWPALLSLLKSPSGQPHPFAWEWPLRFNGEETNLVAVEWNEAFYVPYDLPFDPRSDFAWGAVKWGEEYFLPLEDYARLTGLGYSKAQGEVSLHSPVVYVDDKALGPAIVFHDELYLNALDGSRRLIPISMSVLKLWGQVYHPIRQLVETEVLSQLRLEWPDGTIVPGLK